MRLDTNRQGERGVSREDSSKGTRGGRALNDHTTAGLAAGPVLAAEPVAL